MEHYNEIVDLFWQEKRQRHRSCHIFGAYSNGLTYKVNYWPKLVGKSAYIDGHQYNDTEVSVNNRDSV